LPAWRDDCVATESKGTCRVLCIARHTGMALAMGAARISTRCSSVLRRRRKLCDRDVRGRSLGGCRQRASRGEVLRGYGCARGRGGLVPDDSGSLGPDTGVLQTTTFGTLCHGLLVLSAARAFHETNGEGARDERCLGAPSQGSLVSPRVITLGFCRRVAVRQRACRAHGGRGARTNREPPGPGPTR